MDWIDEMRVRSERKVVAMLVRCMVVALFLLEAGGRLERLAAEEPPRPPASVWPALEAAAAADAAQRHAAFEAVAQDTAAPAHVRALALLGAARTAAGGRPSSTPQAE